MKIKIILENETKELDLNGVSISLSDLKIGDNLYFKDIKEISFDENSFIMQMVDGIRDCCIISYKEYGNEIKLSTYKETK